MLTRNDLAVIIAHHGDMYGAETVEPADIDYELADQIIRDRDQAIYFAILSNDAHGYVRGFRRLLWIPVFIALVAVLVLTHTTGAH